MEAVDLETTDELTRAEWVALINGYFGVQATGILGASSDVSAAVFDPELRLTTPEYERLRSKLKAMPPEQVSALTIEVRQIASSNASIIEDFLASKPACSSNFMRG